jgi:hypothetical protein
MTNITFETHPTDKFGEIITIYRNLLPIGRVRQIGKTHSDCRLEWLSWKDGKQIEKAIQFPFARLSDITQKEIEKMAEKYLGCT